MEWEAQSFHKGKAFKADVGAEQEIGRWLAKSLHGGLVMYYGI